jgi:hypothetical protein
LKKGGLRRIFTHSGLSRGWPEGGWVRKDNTGGSVGEKEEGLKQPLSFTVTIYFN